MRGISLGRVTMRLLLARVLTYALALVNSIVVARSLGVDRLGAYSYALGIAALFSLLPNMGLSTVVTRTIAQDPEAGASAVRGAVRIQGLVAGAVLVVIPAFAALLPEQPVAITWVALAAVQLAIGTLSWPYLAVLGGHARYDRVAVAELLSGIGGSGSLIVAALVSGSVAGFLTAHVMGAALAVVVARSAAAPFLPRRQTPRRPLASLLRESIPFGVTAAVQSFYTRVDILLLGQMAPTSTVGLYSAAYKPITLMAYFGATGAGPLFPVLAQWSGTGPLVPFERAVRGLAVVAPALALGLSGLAQPLLSLLYGRDFAAAAPALVVLAWSAVANWYYAPFAIALQARGRERWWLAGLLGGFGLNAAVNLWAIPRWGASGAASATLASEAALLLTGLAMARVLGLPFSLRPFGGALVAATLGGATLWLLAPAGPFVATLAALLVYVAALVPFQLVTVGDVVTVIGWLRQAPPGWSRG